MSLEGLSVGARVVIYEPGGGIECDAFVRQGRSGDPAAEMIEGTIRDTDDIE